MSVNNLVLQGLFEEQKIIKKETTPNFKVDDYKNPPEKDIQKGSDDKPMYRSKKLPGGEVVRFAIMKNKGPRGGSTKATSFWRPK